MNQSVDVAQFQDQIGVKFKDISLLERAFIHRSYINEHPKSGLEHNERLEFLGDAVLELVVTDYLYRNYPNPEGELTNYRSALVKTDSLSSVAAKLGVGEYLKLSRGEAKGNERSRALISANCIEAIIGAIYLDQGYESASNFINKMIITTLPDIIEEGSYLDPKSRFQELAQESEGVTPHYKVLKESGPDHDKTFEVGAFLGKKLLGTGVGSSKQVAQLAAAADALEKISK